MPNVGVCCYALVIEPLQPIETRKAQSGAEWPVRRRLRSRGIEHWLPIEEIRQERYGRRVNPRLVPFMPGYIFIWADLNKIGTEWVKEIKGASRLLRGACAEPWEVPAAAVTALQKLEDAKDRVIRIRQHTAARFKVGEEVRSIEGITEGLVGNIISAERHGRAKVLFGSLSIDHAADALVAA